MKLKSVWAMMLAFGTSAAFADRAIEIRELPIQIEAVTTLANISVGPTLKRYSIRVRNCAADISHIMLRVADAGLKVNGAGVTYTNGESNQYSFTYTFAAGYDSPWVGIDSFKEADKCVKAVFVNAQSNDPQIKSRVTVFGNSGN